MPQLYNPRNLCSKHRYENFELHAFRYNNIFLFLSLLFAGFTILSVLWKVSDKKEGDNVVLHLLTIAVCVCIIQIAFVSHAFLDLNNFIYNVLRTPLFQKILRRIGILVENFGDDSSNSVAPVSVSSLSNSVAPVSVSSLSNSVAPVSVSSLFDSAAPVPVSSLLNSVAPVSVASPVFL